MAGIQHKGYRPEDVRDHLAAFWEPGGKEHFREEEEILLPVYAKYASPNHPVIVDMLLEHVQIRSLIHQILKDGQLSVEIMERLGHLLEEHVRKEERVVFPLIEQTVPDEELTRLAPFFHMHFSPDAPII